MNADQYYIKTAEYFRDYAFRVSNGKRVHFKLIEADTLQHNNGQAAGQERRFILHERDPIAGENGDLIIRFEYRPDADKRKQTELNAESTKKVPQFGESTRLVGRPRRSSADREEPESNT